MSLHLLSPDDTSPHLRPPRSSLWGPLAVENSVAVGVQEAKEVLGLKPQRTDDAFHCPERRIG